MVDFYDDTYDNYIDQYKDDLEKVKELSLKTKKCNHYIHTLKSHKVTADNDKIIGKSLNKAHKELFSIKRHLLKIYARTLFNNYPYNKHYLKRKEILIKYQPENLF